MNINEILEHIAKANAIRSALSKAAKDKYGRNKPETRYMEFVGVYQDDHNNAIPGSLIVEFTFNDPAPYSGSVTVVLTAKELSAIQD